MSSTYSPTAVRVTDTTLPDDGDTIEAVDVNVPLEAALDGVVYATVNGADRLDVLANIAALTALTTPTNNLVRHVKGHGLFVFDTGATPGLTPFALAADDLTAGAWVASSAHETTKTVLVPCAHVRGITYSAGVAPVALSTNVDFAPLAATHAIISGRGFYPLVIDVTTAQYGWLVPLDAFLIDGATLSSAVMSWRPVGGHGALPIRQGGVIGIVRTALAAYSPAHAALKSTASGFANAPAVSVGTYEVDQLTTFTPDQNNIIDRTLYSYDAIIFDEGGTHAVAGNRYAAIALTFTAIPDARRS